VQARFVEKLSRARTKDLAHDYLETREHAGARGDAGSEADRFKGLKLKVTRGSRRTPTRRPLARAARARRRRSGAAPRSFARSTATHARTAMRSGCAIRISRSPASGGEEMKKAAAELERVRPAAARDLLNAVKYEGALSKP